MERKEERNLLRTPSSYTHPPHPWLHLAQARPRARPPTALPALRPTYPFPASPSPPPSPTLIPLPPGWAPVMIPKGAPEAGGSDRQYPDLRASGPDSRH